MTRTISWRLPSAKLVLLNFLGAIWQPIAFNDLLGAFYNAVCLREEISGILFSCYFVKADVAIPDSLLCPKVSDV